MICSLAFDILRLVGSVAPEFPPLRAIAKGVEFEHCAVIAPLASLLVAITPALPKSTVVAETRQFVEMVAVQVVALEL